MIYLAIGSSLCGILCIEDPIRKDAGKAIELLKDEGIENVLMITGDGERLPQTFAKTRHIKVLCKGTAGGQAANFKQHKVRKS